MTIACEEELLKGRVAGGGGWIGEGGCSREFFRTCSAVGRQRGSWVIKRCEADRQMRREEFSAGSVECEQWGGCKDDGSSHVVKKQVNG